MSPIRPSSHLLYLPFLSSSLAIFSPLPPPPLRHDPLNLPPAVPIHLKFVSFYNSLRSRSIFSLVNLLSNQRMAGGRGGRGKGGREKEREEGKGRGGEREKEEDGGQGKGRGERERRKKWTRWMRGRWEGGQGKAHPSPFVPLPLISYILLNALYFPS